MDHAGNAAEVNQTMHLLPPRSAKPGDPFPGGGHREWDHERHTNHAGEDKWPLDDVLQDFAPKERLIKPHVTGYMQASLEERKQAKHSSKADKTADSRDPSQWRNRQSDHQES